MKKSKIAARGLLCAAILGLAGIAQAEDKTETIGSSQYLVHVPASYDGTQPFGVIVYIPGTKDKEKVLRATPTDWVPVLEERKLILISPHDAMNGVETSKRIALGMRGLEKMKSTKKIDSNRVYAAGLSGGARIASAMGFTKPSVFKGTIQSCGTDFPGAVRKDQAKPNERDHGQPYGILDGPATPAARSSVRFVLITGPKDFRYGNILDIYNGGFKKQNYKCLLIDDPKMGHQNCTGESLAKALDFIESKTP